MDKKPVKKEVKSQPLANLPVVTLTENDMSSVRGGKRVKSGSVVV